MAVKGGRGAGGRGSVEFWLLVIGTVAGVVGAVAAVAVFVAPTWGDRRASDGHQASVTEPALPATTSSGPVSGGSGPTIGGSSETRYLAALTPVAGPEFVTSTGNDLQVSCPTNQSDDIFHEVTYALPANYAQFASGMTVAGQADSDATAGVQVFIQHRLDRSDRLVQAGDPVVLRQGASATFARALGDAVQLTLRITCSASSQVIVLTTPRITR